MSTYFTPMYPDGGFFSAGVPPIAMLSGHVGSQAAQQPFQTVTPVTAVSGLPIGSAAVSGTSICHVTVTASLPNSTISFAHGLLYKPTMCWILEELAEGTTPTAFVGAVISDFTTTNIVINVSLAGVYDVYYV